MSIELTADLIEHLESWTQIFIEFETLKKENENLGIIIGSLKEECKASRASEKTLSSIVVDIRKQIANKVQELNELKKKTTELNSIIEKDKNEKRDLRNKIESVESDLQRQAAKFKDEKELMQSHYLFQISELNDEITKMKNEKSNDLNNIIVDYENKLYHYQIPLKQLEEENTHLFEKLKEKESENSILTQRLKENNLEILQLKNKIDNIEQTLEKSNDRHVNTNHGNTTKQCESKNNGIMSFEKQSNKKEAPLNVIFNQANKKISPMYKKANSTFTFKKNFGKKKIAESKESSFNNGCVYPIKYQVEVNPPGKLLFEKRALESEDNENDPPPKKLLPNLDSQKIETDDDKSNKKKPIKKRSLFSHNNFEIDPDLPLGDNLTQN